jgi:4-hydroxy-tetrahydrodipicolinate synthase
MKKPLFYGVGTALVTPFSGGEIDFTTFARLIERQIAEGADALIVCGTTAETPTLSVNERRACIQFVCEQAQGRIPVIAGCGCNDTKKTIADAQFAKDAGANGLLLVTPYYNRPSEEGLIAHFYAVADAVDCPILLYNVPARTGVDLSAHACAVLSCHERIVGVKEAGGNVAKAAKILCHSGDDFSLYCGDDALTLPMIACGARGVISVCSNLIPRQMHDLCDTCLRGDFAAARAQNRSIEPLWEALALEVNPVSIKAAMEEANLCRATVRLPLCEPHEEVRSRLRAVVARYL